MGGKAKVFIENNSIIIESENEGAIHAVKFWLDGFAAGLKFYPSEIEKGISCFFNTFDKNKS